MDISLLLFLVCLIGILGMVLLVMLYGYITASLRSTALRQKVDALGFHYESYNLLQHILPGIKQTEKARELLAEPHLFPLFALGEPHRRQIYNLISGIYQGVNFLLFDHVWYGVGKAKPRSGKGARQTVLRLELPHGSLPGFCFRPGSKPVFYRFLPGFTEISLESTHPLASRYWLQGDNPEQVRAIFNDEVLEWLAKADWLSVEGRGEFLFIYRRPHLMPAHQMETFLQQGVQLLQLIEKQGS